jgi:hypothetical protein
MACKLTRERLETLDADMRNTVRQLQRKTSGSRDSMLNYLQRNDRNGSYTDREVREEFGERFAAHRWSRADAVKEIRRIIYEDILPPDFCKR